MRSYSKLIWLIVTLGYTWIATGFGFPLLSSAFAKGNSVVGLLSFILTIAPLGFFAGYFRLPVILSGFYYWIAALENFVVIVTTTPGESLFSGASSPDWTTAVINTLIYGTITAVVNGLPIVFVFFLGGAIRRGRERRKQID